MKYIVYIVLGFILYWILEFLAISLGSIIGSGTGEIGIVISAISILSTIIVICTIIIVDTIRNKSKDK